jgi:hypothetical protein
MLVDIADMFGLKYHQELAQALHFIDKRRE